jgi:hypothetical protein
VIWYRTGLWLMLQICFWGLGLAWWILPPRWRRFWPAFCAPAGLGLQSAVVWAGAHTTLRGTDSYAFASLLLPAALLAASVWRLGLRPAGALLLHLRRWWAVCLIMTGSFVWQIYPFTKPPGVLTAVALGSCDAADYAAGARVFKEFSSADRSGFLGLTEVVRILSVDNFYDFWLRLNHFTPSALIALDASLFGLRAYQLTSLLAVVLLVLSLPSVFWLARSGFRFGRLGSVVICLIYAFSPILFYTVCQDSLGQLLAAPAVVLLLWVGLKAYQGPGTWRRYGRYSGLLLLGNWLLLGSYNFFLIFAYVPLAAYVGGRTLWERTWRRGLRWGAFAGVNLLVCTVLFPGRVLSVLDRFRLFDQTPFGWPIDGFRPAGWYGGFADALLHPATGGWWRIFGLLCLGTLAWAIFRESRRAPRLSVWLAACTLPILAGYGILLWEDARTHRNQSYDAFKLFSVFYPGLLAGFCLWLRALRGAPWWARAWGGILCAVVLAVNGAGAWRFNFAMRRLALTLEPEVIQIGSIEKMAAVPSVNVCLQALWPRIWANYFLLDKPQYFPLTTYEGRRATPLRGQWDLRDALLEVRPAESGDEIDAGPGYYVLKRQAPEFLDVDFGAGWYAPEHLRGQYRAWSAGTGEILVTNPHSYPLRAALQFSLRAVGDRHMQLWAGATCLWQGKVGVPVASFAIPDIAFAPGANVLRFDSIEPANPPSADESRPLAFALCGLRVDLRPLPSAVPALGMLNPPTGERGWIALSLTRWVPVAAQPPDFEGAEAPMICHRVGDNAIHP